MSDTMYDSVLVGYTKDPVYIDDKLAYWSVKFKVAELQEMIDKYSTPVKENGEGGNVYCTLGMSKSGKPYTTVYDYNSEKAKEKRAEKQAQAEAVTDGMPF